MTECGAFERWGAAGPSGLPGSPVVLSVPHAGRDYPTALRVALRAPFAAVQSLEDRHVDALALSVRRDETLLVQRRARAWIDLNRHEDERDPRIDEGALAAGAVSSAKLRSGLGLVPRRSALAGDLWRRKWSGAEVEARIAADHRPYHAAVAAALAAARARWGVAVLLDLHSMPPLGSCSPARAVLGDRFGRSAGMRFVARAEGVLTGHGIATALNAPYAGGHILERHGAPAAAIHAIQLELDRSLYLDSRFDAVAPAALARLAHVLRDLVDALADEALAGPVLLAAE